MKKIIFALVLCFVSTMCFGQFSSKVFEVESEDEFGDKTGSVNFGITLEGKFSNSATTGSFAICIIKGSNDSDLMVPKLYEYGKYKSNEDFKLILINDKDEKISSDYAYISKRRSILGEITFKELIRFLKETETVRVKLVERTTYGTPTVAVFKIDNPKELLQVIEKYHGDN